MSERTDGYWDYAEAAWVRTTAPPEPDAAAEVPPQRTAVAAVEEADVRS